jgi:inhibitor of KinA
LTTEDVIRIHTSSPYTVYMNGFVPGFAYMGEVEESIAMDRKSSPVAVAAGSVGIAGKQTGVYPLPSPGGWQVIGRTPLQLFDPQAQDPVLLQPGDRVQFYPITYHEFENYQGRTA